MTAVPVGHEGNTGGAARCLRLDQFYVGINTWNDQSVKTTRTTGRATFAWSGDGRPLTGHSGRVRKMVQLVLPERRIKQQRPDRARRAN